MQAGDSNYKPFQVVEVHFVILSRRGCQETLVMLAPITQISEKGTPRYSRNANTTASIENDFHPHIDCVGGRLSLQR